MKQFAILIAAFALLISPADRLCAADWVETETANNMFALDTTTGAVIGIDVKAGKARLYPKQFIDGKNQTVAAVVGIAAGASDVLFKRYKDKGYFLICFANSPQIFVMDSRTLQITARIAVKERVNSTIAATGNPDDPFVYYIDEKSSRCGWISLATGKWVASAHADDNTHLAISADGQYMYCRDCTSSPTGFYCHRKVTDPTTGEAAWTVVFHQHTSVPEYVPDPFSRYCAVGTNIYSADLKQKITTLDFTPRCFFRSTPAIVGLKGKQLVAASYNSFKTFSRTELPDGFVGKSQRSSSYRRRYSSGPIVCLADDANGRVVLVCGQRIMTKTLKDLKVPDEPLLICDIKGPRSLPAGSEAVFTVTPLDKNCSARLLQGPTGMKLSGSKLTWTPAIDQVGPAVAVIETSAGKLKASQNIRVNVARSFVSPGLTPSGMHVSPDGERAVVWTGSRDRFRETRQPAKLALIDLKKMQILATKTLPYSIGTAAVDANFVYVAPADSDRINALDLKDLSRKNYTITDSGVRELLPVASKRLVADTSNHGPKVYEVPRLKIADSPISAPVPTDIPYARMVYRMTHRQDGRGMPVRVGDNWYAAGCLFGPDLASARMLVAAGGMPSIARDLRRQPPPPIIPLPWNRILRSSELITRSEQRITRFENAPTTILTGAPLAASLTVTSSQGRGFRSSTTQSAVLTLRELVSGKVVRKLPLMSEVPAPVDRSGYASTGLVAGAGRRVVAVAGNRLFVHVLSAETLKQCPVPFDFAPLEQPPVLDPAKPTVVAHKTVGGTDPIEFELLGSQKELDINTKTGAVTFDSPALAKTARDQLIAEISQRVNIDIAGEPNNMSRMDVARRVAAMGYLSDARRLENQTPRQAVAQIVRKAAERFKAYTGKAPKGIPVLVPVRVAATDKHQQVASMQYQAVIDIPRADILKVIDALIAKAKKQRELAEKERQKAEKLREEQMRKYREQEERRRAAYAAARGPTTKPADSEAFRKLEQRIEKLEAKVDILIELLRRRKEK